jgi:hypothetical protein
VGSKALLLLLLVMRVAMIIMVLPTISATCCAQGEASFGGAELEARVRLGGFLALLQGRGVMPELLGRAEVEEVLRRVLLASDCPALATSVGGCGTSQALPLLRAKP